MTWLWWAPLVAAALHIIEEFVYPGGFADWDRAYRPAIKQSITPRFHLAINAGLLLLCVQIGVLAPLEHTSDGPLAVGAWLALSGLLFSNAIFHIVGTIRTGRRSPGVVTGVALYMPLAVVGYWWFLKSGATTLPVAIGAAIVGSSYHLWSRLAHAARAKAGQAGGLR